MQPSVKKNYLYRLIYEILISLTPFITAPYISRVLGADGVGEYSFARSMVTYFMLFGALGTVSYGTREIARNRDDRAKASKLFWEIELMTVFTAGICLIAWIIFILFSTRYRPHYLAMLPFILSTMFDISWYFTGYEKVKNIVLRNLMVRISSILLLFLLVKTKEDVVLYCAIDSLTVMLGNLSMWIYIPRMVERVPLRELRFKRHFHETLIYFIPAIATSIYTVLDKTLIGALTGSAFQNGYYEQATKIITVVKAVVFVAINSVMGARNSYLFAEKQYGEIKTRIHLSMNIIYLLGFGAIFGISGIAKTFVPLFFGKGFDPVILLLYVMSPLLILIGTSNCLGTQYYTPSGQRKRSAKFIILGSFINLCLNLLLIPKFEAIGATVASIIAEVIITSLYINRSDGYFSWKQVGQYSWKRLIAGVIMFVIVHALGNVLPFGAIYVVCVQVLVGVIAYLGVLWLMRDALIFELLGMAKTFLQTRKFS